MTNCIFYSLFFILFLQVSVGSLRLSQVNRTFLSIYKGMLEASMSTVNSNGEPTLPYFDSNMLVEYVDEYIGKKIEKYVTNYELSYVFYQKNGTFICLKDCRKVDITLKAQINYFYNYEKTQSFLIMSRNEL